MENFRRNQIRINFRDPQKIFNRDIYTSFKIETGKMSKQHSKQECIIHSASKRIESLLIGTFLSTLIYLII